MRRLILEVSEKELFKAGIELPPVKKIKSLELLYFLRQDDKELAAISRVEFNDPELKIEEFTKSGLLNDVQIIEKEKKGTYILFTRTGAPSLSAVLKDLGIQGGYLFPPLGIEEGKVKFSFIGSEKQIKEFMEKLDAIAIHYRVVLLADANFSPISPFSQLTEKQQEVLLTAYKLGYYDIPRKITSQQIADKLKIADSTVVEHLRKAELRIIKQIIESKIQSSGS